MSEKKYDIQEEDIRSGKSSVETPESWLKLIQEKKINISTLAEMTGIKRSTLSNKLNPEHFTKLTLDEFRMVKKSIFDWSEQLAAATKIYPKLSE